MKFPVKLLNECAALRRQLASPHAPTSPAAAGFGLGGAVAQIEKAITHGSDWPARSGAAPEDVAAFWTHVLTLHRRTRTLHKELKSAEQALGSEPNEENFLWLRDVQERLATVEGTEALIEGFGDHSGRPARSL